jgi:uncharacterized protein
MLLEIGYNHPIYIRQEMISTDGIRPLTVLFITDLHCNAHSQQSITYILRAVHRLQPSIILLGGDYVDTQKGILVLENFLSALAQHPHVFAIAGNHDYFFGIKKIEAIFTKHGIAWIEKKSITVTINHTIIQIDGNQIFSKNTHAAFAILLLHQPIDIAPVAPQYQLALAGHLHGCQFVFWQKNQNLYPGKWFYKWNILKTKIQNCHYFISKGAGDTLPIRFNCKKDLICIAIQPH